MRNFDADVAAELAKEVLFYYNTIEFQFTNTYRYTDRDASVFYAGNRYYPRAWKFGNIALSGSMNVDKVSIVMDNTDRVFSGILLNEDTRNKPVIISFGVRIKPADVAGSVSLANMRLSLADGAAFADVNVADILTDHINSRLTIFDSLGKAIVGYTDEAGVVETLDSELIIEWTNGTFNVFTSSGENITSAIKSGIAYGSAGSNGFALTQGALYKFTHNLTLNSGVVPYYKIAEGANEFIGQTAFAEGAETVYKLSTISASTAAIAAYLVGASLTDFSCTFTLRRVLTPSSNGVTIVSTPGGSTQNWASIETGFNYNDPAGYTYTIEYPEEDRIEPIFTGILAGWDIEGDSKVKIEVANEFILWNKKTLRKHAASCPWAFKGEECGYAGTGKSICDKSYDTCLNLGNQTHFGGFRFLPVIAEKELWWGKTRG